MITLAAHSRKWKNSGQYIARIKGRNTKFTFEREFTGKKNDQTTQAFIDEPGLFELCDIDKKGRKEAYYMAVITRPANCPPLSANADREFLSLPIALKNAVEIAKRIENGESLENVIEVVRDSSGYSAALRSKAEARKASAAATIESAVEQCWQVLQSFPEKEAKKVLAALKARVSPPKSAPITESGESAEVLFERGRKLIEEHNAAETEAGYEKLASGWSGTTVSESDGDSVSELATGDKGGSK